MPNSEKLSLTLGASPEELALKFHNLSSPQDVAGLLEIDYGMLVYYLHKVPDESKYTVFHIKKRGSTSSLRTISAPAGSLKIIQTKLLRVLSSVYAPKASVHGFCMDRSILTNARKHINQKYVLNIDLANFFPTINFGRVRGMFIAKPYGLSEKVATVLAQICCFKNELPQGAPTSPIISNMICSKMDTQLRLLAQRSRCVYTRYADDLTFSTSAPRFPPQLGTVIVEDKGNYFQLGDQLVSVITSNGFQINNDKVRLQTKTHRQEVTGLVTNQFPNVKRKYVRQVRAMLHAWQKYGLEKAEQEHFEKYRRQDRSPYKGISGLSFKRILLGKIEFIGSIRGKSDFVFINLLSKLVSLSPDLAAQKQKVVPSFAAGSAPALYVTTEGPTDWMHIKSAFRALNEVGKYVGLPLALNEYDSEMGEAKLLSACKAYSNVTPPGDTVYVFIFDRDIQSTLNEVNDGGSFKRWSERVFSFAIPVPRHRQKTPEISIEFYYRDDEIQRVDKNGRRLFISTEFNGKSHRHNQLDLFCTDANRFKNDKIRIIDNSVFDKNDENIALPKKHFAKYVLDRTQNFDGFNFETFGMVFDWLLAILQPKTPPS